MPGFVKRYPDAATARKARLRAAALAARGVPTPPARFGPGDRALTFEPIEGRSGHALAGDDLAPLLAVIARMHRIRVPGLPLFDPFLRIRPRTGLATRLPVADVLAEPVPTGKATLHGDLHLGQFMEDRDGRIWIVDLDDMAVGPPEADLGNFAAHMATTFPDRSIGDWAATVRSAWTGLGHPCDGDAFTRFLRFALLRRHLKLRAAGRADLEAEILAYLRESSNFSIL